MRKFRQVSEDDRVRKTAWWKTAYGLFLLCAATAITLHAQTLNTLASFDAAITGYPPFMASLAQGTDGNFYGTTLLGGNSPGGCYGDSGCGTVFKVTSSGSLTVLHTFVGADGNQPLGLVLGTDGNFYGATYWGGADTADCPNDVTYGGCGTVFKITPSGVLTTLHSFTIANGEEPITGLVRATNGAYYGTTYAGGADGYGTVFEITSAGTLTRLHSFALTDGAYPDGRLIQATDGNLYGTTSYGASYAPGTIFKITPSGSFTTVYTFSPSDADGAYPEGGLIQATDGDFYGTTALGGLRNAGTVFKMTPSGTLTTLYNFCSQVKALICADGAEPTDALVQATDGNFYGTTLVGGSGAACLNGEFACGTVFKITPAGVLTTLHNFCSQPNCADGSEGPSFATDETNAGFGGLIQATSGTLYGTTGAGGANGQGTVFSLSVGLKPFVETNPTSGAAGTKVTILGNKLKGTTSVTFNGKSVKSFTVNSTGTAMTTAVPTGATTGYVKVTTPSGTLTSNVKFRVP
jgi:uncharacterized repeat protein (TIGR03803 family)